MKKKIKKRTYTVHGVTMDFSQKEIEKILEKHIPKKVSLPEIFEVAEKPTEGKCFKVEFSKIKHSLFLKERNDEQQERIRKLILEAFVKAFERPEKYDFFYILIPKKEWVYGDKTVIGSNRQKEFPKEVRGYTGTWVEVALGWAQQITNDAGSDEVWKNICNNPDTLKYFRLFIWKNGELRLVGDASEKTSNYPTSTISHRDYNSYYKFQYTVPYVVLKSLHCTV